MAQAGPLRGVLINVRWRYAARWHRLLGAGLGPDQVRRIGRHDLVGPIVDAAATLVALASLWLALLFYLFLDVFYLWPRKGLQREVSARTRP